jgi:hypothetical protein
VDAGSVLFVLTPAAELVVFEPSGESYSQLASYKLPATNTYAHPVIAGNAIYIKDEDSLMRLALE